MKVEVNGKTYISVPEETDYISCKGCIADNDKNKLCLKIHKEVGIGFCILNDSIFKLEK